MKGFVAGMDGGGTKTCVCLMDENERVLGRADYGPLNINGAPRVQVEATIAEILSWIFQHEIRYGPCRALFIGTAGRSNPDAVTLIESAVRAAGYRGLLTVTGDQAIALRGAVGLAGAVLIAGTGSICYGKNAAGESWRCGGYGYLIDDGGSGYAIGRDILAAVVRAGDGRGPKTMLTDAVYTRWEVGSTDALIHALYARPGEKEPIAALAPLLLDGLAQGDAVCFSIMVRAANDLAGLLSVVLSQLNLPEGPFAFTGGILTHYPEISLRVLENIRAIHPRARHVVPQGDAAMGAALLAKDGL